MKRGSTKSKKDKSTMMMIIIRRRIYSLANLVVLPSVVVGEILFNERSNCLND
jgi:hypothetical protein